VSVSVLIPTGIPDGRERSRNLAWIVRWWEREFPEFEVCVGESSTDPYQKAEAFNRARSQASGDVLILADGDCYTAPDQIRKLAADAHHGVWGWPWDALIRTGHPHASSITARTDTDLRVRDGDRKHGGTAGGIVIMPAAYWDHVGGLDPRFVGWGGEDNALIASVAVFYGPPVRIPGPMFHLWHPVSPDRWSPVDPARLEQPNWKLWARYRDAVTPAEMLALIDERRGI
jgi:hypothetical protein